MLLMTLFTPLSNKKSCPEKMFIIVVLRCRDQPEEGAPGGHMWLTTDIGPGEEGGGEYCYQVRPDHTPDTGDRLSGDGGSKVCIVLYGQAVIILPNTRPRTQSIYRRWTQTRPRITWHEY